MQRKQSPKLPWIIQRLGVFLLLAVLLPIFMAGPRVAHAQSDQPGAVYVLTNDPAGNAVLVYGRGGDGSLTPFGSFATGGAGSGTGLGSQGAVIVSDNHQLLFAVNAGSNTISAFRIESNQSLTLVSTLPSGGVRPTSVAFAKGLLYVLNAGTPNNLSGFTVAPDGSLTPLVDSTRPLSADNTNPAQVSFDDSGATVIVTERLTNRIVTYTVGRDGRLSGPIAHPSAGPVPFGFAIDKRNTLLVSEAGPGGGASSYRVGGDGSVTPVSSMLMTGQRAACWAVVTKNGRYGYVTNAGTGNISGFALGQDGSAALLNTDGVTAITGGNPTDAAVSHNGRFLYVRVALLNSIAIFTINEDGSLTALPALMGTPNGLVGLAAY